MYILRYGKEEGTGVGTRRVVRYQKYQEQLAQVSSLGKGKESAKEISCIISNNNAMRKSIKIPISETKKTAKDHSLGGICFRTVGLPRWCWW